MNLHNIGMLAADTSRSKMYLKELIKKKLLPHYVLLLLNPNHELLPGQTKNHSENEIIKLLKNLNIKYDISYNSNINDDYVIDMITKRPEEIFIFSGYGGILLKDKILDCGKRFLHIHGGYIPDYKGSTTNYYSLIKDNSIGASAIFLTKEIDSGPILIRRKFSPPIDRREIDHKYDSEARVKVLIECLQNFIKSGQWEYKLNNNIGGETYYIIHPVLKHLSILGNGALI